MRRTLSTLLVPVMALLAWNLPTAAEAQQDSDESGLAMLHTELRRLNSHIERITVLLERNLGEKRLELLMRRLELGADRLSVAEKNLRDARETMSSLVDDKLELEARLAQLAEDLELGNVDIPANEIELMTSDADIRLKVLKKKIRDLEIEIGLLENQVMGLREETRDWQGYVDQELSRRQ